VIEMLLRKTVRVIVVLCAASCFSYGSSVTSAEAVQWREDLHYFAEQAPQVHKNLYHSMTREQFEAAVESLDRRIPTLSRNQIMAEIMRIVAMIGDGHTHLEIYRAQSGFRHYAVKFYWFPDGIYVVQADKKYAPIVGGKIVKLGKVSGQEAYDAARQVVPHDNESQIRGSTPLYMTLAEVLDGLGLVDDLNAVPIILEKNGVQVTAVLTPEEGEISRRYFLRPPGWVDARDPASPVPLWLKDPGNFYWYQYLPESNTIYVQFNAVAEKPDETIEAFFKRVFAFAEAHPVDHFVLDERLNDGGNNYLLRPVIHGFIRSDKVNQSGKLFTIIGRYTFSAAMNCVNRMKLNTDTLFVGEPTASSPNHYGDNAPVVLPNSKLTIRLSTLWWQDMDPRDARPWQAPDLSTELTFADYRSGRDPAMEAILQYKPGPSIAEIIRGEAEKNDSAGAKDALDKFQSDPLHKYATVEQDLNRLGYDFINEKKLDQAILVLKLNVEAFPASFNTWDSLGEAYMIRGDKDLAIRNYSKSLELNPKNAGARAQLAKLRAQ
jgi:tetratricopeptide (TPR) repeat protein